MRRESKKRANSATSVKTTVGLPDLDQAKAAVLNSLATAILDRLLHKSHVLNIKGRSYRW